MAGKATISIGVNGNQAKQGLSSISGAAQDLAKKVDEAKKELNELMDPSSFTGLEDAMDNFDGVSTAINRLTSNVKYSTLTAKQQLKAYKNAASDLTVSFDSLSDEEKFSAAGRALNTYINSCIDKAGSLSDAIGDTQAAIKAASTDHLYMDALVEGTNLAISGFGALSSVAGAFGADEKELTEIQKKFNTVITISNFLDKVHCALQRESSLMMTLRAAKTSVATIMTTKDTIATKAATLAQEAFNATVKANPLGAVLTVVASVATAFAIFGDNADDAAEKEKKLNEELEKTKNHLDKLKEASDYNTSLDIRLDQALGDNDPVEAAQKKVDANKRLIDSLVKEFNQKYAKLNEDQVKEYEDRIDKAREDQKKLEDDLLVEQVKADNKSLEETDKKLAEQEKKEKEAAKKRADNYKESLDKQRQFEAEEQMKSVENWKKALKNKEKAQADYRKAMYGTSGSPSDAISSKYSEAKTIDQEISEVKKAYDELAKYIQENNNNSLISKEQMDAAKDELDVLGDKLEGFYKKQKKQKDLKGAFDEQVEGYNKTADAISNVGSAFDNLSSATEGSAAAMFSFMGATADAASSILKQCASIVAAKEAEALASGTAGAAKIPFPANIAAIASIVATIAGYFAKVKSIKFAQGGIIGGSTSVGDYNLARVNGGEMILNGTQQSRLFKMLNSDGYSRTNNSINGGEVSFRISGQDLVGTLSNYNIKQNKVR